MKLAAAGIAVVLAAVLLQGCLFGGDDAKTLSVARSGPISTATPPATLPEPILLGQAQGTGGGSTSAASNAPNTYIVKTGDTLGAIAGSQGIATDQQAAWIVEVLRLNGIEDARLLKAGQELQLPRIPTQTAAARTTPGPGATAARSTPATSTPVRAGSPAAGATATPRPPASGGAGTYTVQSGDFPLAIAAKLNIPAAQQPAWVNELIALNNLNPTSMSVGQVLQLPAGTPGGGSGSQPAATSTRAP
jgi:LysM repeat protein